MRRKHNAFTFVEVLTTIMILGILASITIYSGTEIIVTAKAQKIVDNLMALKMATIEWAKDNMDKIQYSNDDKKCGTVRIKEKDDDYHPVQEFTDEYLKISKYLDSGTSVKYNETTHEDGKDGNRSSTNLNSGGYGICDGGTQNGDYRYIWYAGYAFTDDEEAVKQKIKSKADFYNVKMGDRDAHTSNSDDAVWVKIFELYH